MRLGFDERLMLLAQLRGTSTDEFQRLLAFPRGLLEEGAFVGAEPYGRGDATLGACTTPDPSSGRAPRLVRRRAAICASSTLRVGLMPRDGFKNCSDAVRMPGGRPSPATVRTDTCDDVGARPERAVHDAGAFCR